MDNKISDLQKIVFFDDSWKHIKRILEIMQKKKPKDIPLGYNMLEYVADHLEGWIDQKSN